MTRWIYVAVALVAACKQPEPAGAGKQAAADAAVAKTPAADAAVATAAANEWPAIDRPAGAPGADLAALKAGWLHDAEQNLVLRCPRPLLRGEASADDGVAALDDLLHWRGDLDRCKQLIQDMKAPDLLVIKPDKSKPQQGTYRGYPVARALDDKLSRGDDIGALEVSCAPAVAAIVLRLAQRGAPCSPYLAGRRASDEPYAELQVGRLVVIEARRLARAGDVAGAAHLLLVGAQFAQDIERGPAPMLVMMVAVANRDLQLVELERLLSATPALPAAELDALAAEIEVLWASDPEFVDGIIGEGQFDVLLSLLPSLYAEGEAPPGGWPLGSLDRNIPKPEVESRWRALLADVAIHRAACPRGTPMRACYDAAAQLDAHPPVEPKAGKVSSGFGEGMHKYVARFARSRYQLAALRWHVATLRAGGCDPAKTAQDFAAPPELGDPLTAVAAGDGEWDLTGPSWIEQDAKDGVRAGVWRMRCAK